MNKIVICFVIAAMFLLPTVNCVSVSVQTNVGAFTEHLGSGVGGQINGNTVITRDALSHAVWANGPVTSGNNNRGCSYASTKSVSDNAGDTASTSVSISNAKSYSYRYGLSNMGSFAAAAEALDVTGASSINAQAKAYNTKVAAPDVSVSTTVTNGDLHGYNNMAIAAANLAYAFQSFDSATGTKVQCDSVARGLSSKWSSAQENAAPEASISTSTTKAGTTITNYEDSVTKSSSGTSIEQNAHIVGTFTSTSAAKGTSSLTRTSNYGTKYDIDMQANIANSLPSVKGTLAYYINPNLKIQTAIANSMNGDTINLAPGTYNEQVNIQKAVTVRGDNVVVTQGVTNNGGNVYIDSTKVFLRADDLRMMSEWQPSWTWFTNLISSEKVKATIAVIPQNSWGPDTLKSISELQSLDKSKIELATHGDTDYPSMGGYNQQYAALSAATDLMTGNLYRPRTFVAPFLDSNANTLNACKALGYHTIVGDYVAGATGINQQYGNNFEWESSWPATGAIPHHTLGEFETSFDAAYNSGTKIYEIAAHPETMDQAAEDAYASSIDYMKSKTNQYGSGVDFMTFDQYYNYNLYNQ